MVMILILRKSFDRKMIKFWEDFEEMAQNRNSSFTGLFRHARNITGMNDYLSFFFK